MTELAIVIPLYNEEDCIGTLRTRIGEFLERMQRDGVATEILIVNDGSTDRSLDRLQTAFHDEVAVRILSLDRNRGFGGALRAGLEVVEARWVATVDADTNYDIREVPILLEIARRGEADLVTASPWHPEGERMNFPLGRYLCSIGVAYCYSAVRLGRPPRVHTYTSGFRVYDGFRIRAILPRATDFIATAELLINAIEAGWRIREVPWRVADRLEGRSKIRTIRTIRGHLVHMGRILARRLSR